MCRELVGKWGALPEEELERSWVSKELGACVI